MTDTVARAEGPTHGLLSIIVPVYNEGAATREAFAQISGAMSEAAPRTPYEIVFVDDGSADDSFECIRQLAAAHAHVKGIRLSANCGSHMAIRAGLDHARGDAACFIACDMQEPPAVLARMLDVLQPPYSIVWAVRSTMVNNSSSRFFSLLYYWLGRTFVSRTIPPSGATMFMLDRRVLDAVKQYPERNLTLDGLFATLGFRSRYVRYDPRPRVSGASKWTLGKKVKHLMDFFIGHTFVPIRLVSVVGIGLSLVGFAWALYLVVRRLVWGDLVQGWTALVSILLICFGVTNISLGIIAEYLWRTLDEARRRPRYVIEETANL